jgi:hypothetical protein
VEGGWRPGRAIRPPGDPAFCRAWPGFGTTFSNLLSNVSPSVVDDGGGFNGADNLREAPLSGRIGPLHLGFYPPHAHPGRISGPHKKGEGRAPARTEREGVRAGRMRDPD